VFILFSKLFEELKSNVAYMNVLYLELEKPTGQDQGFD
jgi:hypothetical protein